ncbi:MAG: hypothetical protein M5U16_08190 [Hyphomicrobium sp.]|nr:hypothetical protein [Hyphomicrobium sp.]
MNAYESARLLVMLAATGLVSSAGAMELSQPSAPAPAEAPGFTLPAFLDGARLPDLQEAWRAHFGFAGEPTASPSVEPVAAPADDPNLQAARATLSRAEQLDREAAAVRERAEELSRRFGAEGGDNGTTNAPASAAPAETASIGSSNAADAAAPVTEQVLAPAGDEAAMVDQAPVPANPVAKASAATDDAPVIEDMATKPAKRAKSEPAPAGRAVQSAARKAAPVVSDFLNVDPAAPKPEADPMMPTELRAFGWNAQP